MNIYSKINLILTCSATYRRTSCVEFLKWIFVFLVLLFAYGEVFATQDGKMVAQDMQGLDGDQYGSTKTNLNGGDPFEKNKSPKKRGEYFRGEKDGTHLSLYFDNIAVQKLLELLAEFKGISLVISESVVGNMNIHLNDVTWDQALDAVLTMENLNLRKKDGIFFITSSAEAVEERPDQVGQEASVSEIFQIHYAEAAALADLVKSSGNLLSDKGNVVADARTNSLWLRDLPERIGKLKKFLQAADIPAKQVRIKAHIVNVNQDSIKELGLKFGTVSVEEPSVDAKAQQFHMDIPLNVAETGHFSVGIAKISSETLLNLELAALEKEGRVRVISNPELITGDRQMASIESGQEIPYQENTSSGATNTVFKKAVLSLQVTPIISSGDKILLNLSVNQDKVSSLVVNGVPAVSTQKVQTQVLMNNGETAVLGGIYEESSAHSNEQVPVLGAIPFVGALFRSKTSRVERRELLIFVRPEII